MRGLWAFGPERNGPNVLMDDTLAGEVDKNLLNAVRDSVIQVRQHGQGLAEPGERVSKWASMVGGSTRSGNMLTLRIKCSGTVR